MREKLIEDLAVIDFLLKTSAAGEPKVELLLRGNKKNSLICLFLSELFQNLGENSFCICLITQKRYRQQTNLYKLHG